MPSPFLTYLTVFKSRLGACNLLIGLTGFAHQPSAALDRKLAAILASKQEVVLDESAHPLLRYLAEKRFITPRPGKSGRYKHLRLCDESSLKVCDEEGRVLDALPVYATDLWMADQRVPSTIGVPTPDNAGECVDLAFQLRLLTKSKNTWTPSGHLMRVLRDMSRTQVPDAENPFLLGAEAVVLLRQVLEWDGVMILEMGHAIRALDDGFSRDDVAERFGAITEPALERAARTGASIADLRAGREFRDMLRETERKAERRRREAARAQRTKSGGPGVLEHRVAPRLEWLTDFGYLSKRGLARNGFAYCATEDLDPFLASMEAQLSGAPSPRWADEVAVGEWRRDLIWSRPPMKDAGALAYVRAYEALRRSIGPTPIREVALLAALHHPDNTVEKTRQDIIEFAATHEGASLAGGRYTRDPENVYFSDKLIAEFSD